jgi:ribonuclease HI
MTPQQILEAIAALSEADRRDLLSRLREVYGGGAQAGLPGPVAGTRRLTADEWSGPFDYLVVFDGGSRGNPGAGYGSYIIFDSVGSGQIVRLDFEREMTNNEAEYHSLLAALGDLRDRLGAAAGQTRVKVLSDSLLVISQVSGKWEAKEPRLRDLRDQARAELKRFLQYRLAYQPREDIVQILGH